MGDEKSQQPKQKVSYMFHHYQQSSLVNKILMTAIVILIGLNVKLYMDNYIPSVSVQFQSNEEGTELSLDYNSKFIKDPAIKEIAAQLLQKKNSLIQTLKLQLSLTSMTQVGLTSLLQSLEQYTQLKTFQFNIGNNPLGNASAYLLGDTIAKLENLEEIKLEIDSLFNETGRTHLIDRISTLPNLKNLTLTMIHTNLSGTGLSSLLGLAKAKKLEKLELILVGCSIKAKETKYLQTMMAQLPKLNDLFINLYANRIEADGAITLAGGIYNQRQATRFGIELFFNNITVKGTETLTGALAQMKNLTRLHLGLEFNYIENEGGVFVADMLGNLTLIEDLHLNLATKNFGYYGYEAVLHRIHKLGKLQKLNLIIGVNKCGVQGAEDLKHLLVRHNKLKSLKFNFLENYVGDVGAKHIADGIRAQKNLEELQVNMNFNSLTDFGALEIVKAVKDAKTPKKIDLRLSQNEINDESAIEIFQLVKSVLPKVNKQRKKNFEFLNTALTNKTRDHILETYQDSKLELRINTIPPSNWDKKQEQE